MTDISLFTKMLAGGNGLTFRIGNIVSVDAGYTLTVTVAGDSTPISSVRYLASMTPVAGQPVVLVVNGMDMWAMDNFNSASTHTARPMFAAQFAGATACTAGTDMRFETVTRNIGSGYNSTNGRFVAPIAGTYYFRAHGLFANADSGDMRMALYKNGSAYEGLRFITYKTANTWITWNVSGHIALAVNDYVTVRYEQGTSGQHTDANYNGFQGWLLPPEV